MNIALIGYGKIGQLICQLAEKKHNILAKIDPHHPEATHSSINGEALSNVDVCIEFTKPSSVVDNIKKIASLGKNMVIGTTGWDDYVDEVKDIVNHYSGRSYLFS